VGRGTPRTCIGLSCSRHLDESNRLSITRGSSTSGAGAPSSRTQTRRWRPWRDARCRWSTRSIEVLVGHVHERRRRTDRKPDKADAGRIAALLAHGLIRPSVVPPAIHARRDLTRTRVALVRTRSQAKHRVITRLEATNIKRSSVVADLSGVSGRRRLAALIAGERAPHVLAALATGRLR
jgi:hypothetical protein